VAEKCVRCGSEKIIADVSLEDHYGESGFRSNPVELKVHGSPGAWVFKDTLSGYLKADVCGECGHVELRVTNPRELYEKYRKSKGQ
jgi:hypothetical protein